MTKFVAVCLGVLVWWSAALARVSPVEDFDLANRVGEPNARSFFLFSTSVGSYAVRQDGMGEVSSAKGMRRVFRLNLGAKGRIERVYFLEHQGELFLLYEVHDASSEWSYLLRMEQTKRKQRWVTAVASAGAPKIEGEAVIIAHTKINKADGKILEDD